MCKKMCILDTHLLFQYEKHRMVLLLNYSWKRANGFSKSKIIKIREKFPITKVKVNKLEKRFRNSLEFLTPGIQLGFCKDKHTSYQWRRRSAIVTNNT